MCENNDIINDNESVDTVVNAELNDDEKKDNSPQVFRKNNIIYIPTKIKAALNHIPAPLLKEIHKKKEAAIELCLLFAMHLTSTYFQKKNDSKFDGWKSLNSRVLKEFFSSSSNLYFKIINVLMHNLEKGPIIVRDDSYQVGMGNKHYRLSEGYIGKGIESYELQTSQAIHLLTKYRTKQYEKSQQNIICKNLFHICPSIKLPTIEEINNEADRLINNGAKNKKLKPFKRINKHKKDIEKYCYVEDSIVIFKHLTDEGLIIPYPGGVNCGGRVYDSISLMPSWIRNLIRINGKQLVECDYSCLHPNIAMSLYGGLSVFLTHLAIANATGIDVNIIKQEHLSFFNKEIWQMKQSQLFSYYAANEPIMLKNIIEEKIFCKEKHKITSKKMLAKEVEIMTQVIEQLNEEEIYVLYVFDALLCEPEHSKRVLEVMNDVVLENGVKTTAK